MAPAGDAQAGGEWKRVAQANGIGQMSHRTEMGAALQSKTRKKKAAGVTRRPAAKAVLNLLVALGARLGNQEVERGGHVLVLALSRCGCSLNLPSMKSIGTLSTGSCRPASWRGSSLLLTANEPHISCTFLASRPLLAAQSKNTFLFVQLDTGAVQRREHLCPTSPRDRALSV